MRSDGMKKLIALVTLILLFFFVMFDEWELLNALQNVMVILAIWFGIILN